MAKALFFPSSTQFKRSHVLLWQPRSYHVDSFLLQQKLKQLLILSSSASAVFSGVCVVKGEPRFYSNILMPCAHAVIRDPEDAHNWAIWALKKGLVPKEDLHRPPQDDKEAVDMVSFVVLLHEYVLLVLFCDYTRLRLVCHERGLFERRGNVRFLKELLN